MKRLLSVFFALAGLEISGVANSAVNITISQSGSDVVATSSGTINTGVCTSVASSASSAFSGIDPAAKTVAFGAVGSSQSQCLGTTITAPSAFGSGGSISASSNSGASFYLYPSGFWGPASFSSSTSFSGTLTFSNNTIAGMGLTAGTYVFTLSNGGTSDTITITITSAPSATTNAASSITTTGATLNGTVSANGASTTVTFEYGLTAGYGSSATASQSPLSSSASSASVSAAITGLTCNTQYHFRVNANNGTGGTINGTDATFTTSACPISTYTIGGTISGLTGSGLVLSDTNAGNSGAITAGTTSFTLPTAVNSGTNYAVTVQTQPTGQTCTVSNGSGTANANVTSVSVTCTTPAAVPTLSEWAQLLLALMVIGIAWHFHNKDQNSY